MTRGIRAVGCSLFALLAHGGTAHLAAQPRPQVVATVEGRPITIDEVDRSIEDKLRPLQQQIYLLRKSALENLILAAVLRSEAARKNVTTEQLRKELTAVTPEITQEEVEAAYVENAPAFGSTSPDEARERLRLDLETQVRMRHYGEALSLLKERAAIEVLLEAPKVVVAAAGPTTAATGSEDAPVTVTEFAHFQCPSCREAVESLKRVLGAYENNVRVIFRHLPSPNHPQAFAAARAAVCATEQGRFWEYHDALFAAESLTPEGLETAAAAVGLDLNAFAECVGAERSSEAVMVDVREAKRLGITTTPTFVVNGVVTEGVLSFAQFQQLINPELEAASPALSAGDDDSQEDQP